MTDQQLRRGAGARPNVDFADGPAVVADGLVKRFGDTEALRGVSFEIPRATVLGGEIVYLSP